MGANRLPVDTKGYDRLSAPLLAALVHHDSKVRSSAASGLRRPEPLALGQEDRDRVAEQLAKALQDEAADVRAAAARALGVHSPDMADLTDAVHDPEFKVRLAGLAGSLLRPTTRRGVA